MSNQEPDVTSPKVERGWNHARFSVATRLPTAVARARVMTRGTIAAVRQATRGKR